jgi:hypothetical protein
MRQFDKTGRLVIPEPHRVPAATRRRPAPVRHLYCPAGHALVDRRAVFDDAPGILLAVRDEAGEHGLVALSPFPGDRRRIAVDIDPVDGQRVSLRCPVCDTPLPVHSSCPCGGDLVALFTARDGGFTACIGVCDRWGCPRSRIICSEDLLAMASRG